MASLKAIEMAIVNGNERETFKAKQYGTYCTTVL